MSKQERFDLVKDKYMKTLQLYVPIVARVHGDSHPEFHHVHKLFEDINSKIAKAGDQEVQLQDEFTVLSQVTQNYALPDDVCESYEAVYKMLSELHKAYGA